MLSEEEADGSDDVLVEQAITILKKDQRASASMLQRRLRIGYPRAARLLDQLEEMGVVGPSRAAGAIGMFCSNRTKRAETTPEDA